MAEAGKAIEDGTVTRYQLCLGQIAVVRSALHQQRAEARLQEYAALLGREHRPVTQDVRSAERMQERRLVRHPLFHDEDRTVGAVLGNRSHKRRNRETASKGFG